MAKKKPKALGRGIVRLSVEEQKRRLAQRWTGVEDVPHGYHDETVASVRTISGSYGSGKRR